MNSMKWLNDFKNPPPTFRPVPFWSWNEKIEPLELRRQIELMANAGWGGGFIHSRIGLLTKYLGEDWFEAADAAIAACRQHGLKVWLYDEDKWPSGFSGGSVPLADEMFRMKALFARRLGAPLPVNSTPIGPPFNELQVYLWIAPLGDPWFNGTCYADLMSKRAMRKFLDDAYESYYRHYAHDYGDEILAQFTDEPCTIMRGRIPAGAVPFTDALIDRFQQIHGYGPVGKLHLLFVDDEEAPRFRLHYFRTINDLFETNFSKQLGDWCEQHAVQLTGHYMAEHTLYAQQLWGVKIMPNYRHQGMPGVDHLCRQIEERITAKQCHSIVNQYGKPRMLSELYGVAGQSQSFEDRLWIASQQIALGVNLLNPHLALYTMAGVRKRDYPQNMFYQQPWWPLNKVIDEPLSRMCVALSQGKYLAEALIIHPEESTFVLWRSKTESSRVDETGERLLWDHEPTVAGAKEAIDALDTQVKGVMDALLESQRTFDFADETVLAQEGVVARSTGYQPVPARAGSPCYEYSVLRMKKMDYPLVILPSMETIAQTTVDLLKQFQNAGGHIIRCGEPPKMIDGIASAELDDWLSDVPQIEFASLAKIVAELVPPMVELVNVAPENARRLFVHIRELPDERRLIFVTNLHRQRAFAAAVLFRGDWFSATALDPRTGEQLPLKCSRTGNGLEVILPFAPTQGHLIVLAPELELTETVSLLPAPVTREIVLPAEMIRVDRLDDNAICLDYASWREDDPMSDHFGNFSPRPMPVIAIQERLNAMQYEGPLDLRYTVQVRGLSASRRVYLVVEHPERYRITVNGREARYAGLPFWRDIRWMPIEITGILRGGPNVIELFCDHFQPGNLANPHDQFARYGTEIESIYLVGDFAVWARVTDETPKSPLWDKWGLPPVTTWCFDEHTIRLTEPMLMHIGDTTVQGLPFYAGRLRLTAPIPANISTSGGRWFLAIDRLDAAVAEVSVGERVLGHFVSHPLELDITDAIARGAREISITLYGTLRNLLGPHHHIDGELPAVSPASFHPRYGEAGTSDRAEFVEQWTRGEIQPAEWRDRYCMISFGDLGRVMLRQR
jgi:hypothetical protein